MTGSELLAWQLVGILAVCCLLLLWDDILNRRCMENQHAALLEAEKHLPKLKCSEADQLRILRAAANGALMHTISPAHPDYDVISELIEHGYLSASIDVADRKIVH